MFSKIELKLAYGLAICLFFVGVLCYAAVPTGTPDQPVRLMFNVTAGKVLFDHSTHHADTGYGISCGDCHHTLGEDEYADAQSCSECHDPDE
ncbi:MAG: cytochrome c3 family protein, partial [Desulfobacterales bacterium]